MKALECSQHYTLIFRRSRAANSVFGDGAWQKFKLIQAFKVVLVLCKNEDRSKNELTIVLTTFPKNISLWGYFQTLILWLI